MNKFNELRLKYDSPKYNWYDEKIMHLTVKGNWALISFKNIMGYFNVKYDVSRFNNPRLCSVSSRGVMRVEFDQGLFIQYPDGTKRFIKYDESINFLTPVI